jgi:hypothetical protein
MALTPERILDVWERGHGQGPVVRALTLLAAAHPAAAWEELGALPLGERDRQLLALREETLGSRMEGAAGCPACGEMLDVALDTRALRSICLSPSSPGEGGWEGAGEEGRGGEGSSLAFRLRSVNSLDLLAAASCSDVEEARRLLAERCVLEARRHGEPISTGGLSEEDLQALSAALAEADPGAELLLELSCPVCRHGWWEMLDVATFFWTELDVQARRLLREVHVLARAYGWREADVLALSPRRRRFYLEMVSA